MVASSGKRPLRSPRHQLIGLVLLVSCLAAEATLGKYDPCTTPGLATKSQGFYAGIAFWPGYTPDDWGQFYNSTSGEYGLNPCNTTVGAGNVSDRDYLAARGVLFAAFELKIDSLAAMKISATDMDALYNASVAAATNQPIVSAVVFRAGFRSEARYILSDDAALSHGSGFVTSLAVAATFANGVLTALTWDDVGCNACGGLLDARCIRTYGLQPQHSCTLTIDSCSTYQNCSMAVYMGYTGSDRYRNVFQTATQVHQINKYSAATIYYNFRAGLNNILAGSGQTLLGGSTISSETTTGTVA